MTPEEFEQVTRQITDHVSTMTLATCDGGIPWATDVYFAADGFNFIFFSSPSSRHCRNLAANPVCAVTIHPNVTSWREIKGIQMEGTAGPVATVLDKARGLAAYLQKFPFAGELLGNTTATVRAFSKAALYVFLPSRIFYLDNSQGFGTRHCVSMMDGSMDGLPEREKEGI